MRTRLSSYASFYAVFFGFHAVHRSFLPLYYQELGFSAFQIALLTASEDVSYLVAPILTITLVRSLITPSRLIVLANVVSILFYLGLFQSLTFLPLVFVVYGAVIALKAPLVLVDTASVRDSVLGLVRLGRLRIAGSLGFIVATFVLGSVYDWGGSRPVLLVGLALLIVFSLPVLKVRPYLGLEEGKRSLGHELREIRQCIVLPGVRPVLGASLLLWASMSAFYSYFSIYIKSLGYGGTTIALAWGVSVFCEVVFLLYHHALERRFSLLPILQVSLMMVILRWIILSSTISLEWILFSQALHAFVIAGYQVTVMKLANQVFPPLARGRAQGLLASVGMGLGLLAGRLLCGVVSLFLPDIEAVRLLFLISAVLTITALWCARHIRLP